MSDFWVPDLVVPAPPAAARYGWNPFGGMGGGLLSAGVGLIGDLFGLGQQRRLQRQAWEREDTAVQRRVADLRAAGLSPTLAAGSAAGSSAPINVMGQYSKAADRVGGVLKGSLEYSMMKTGLRKLEAEAGRSEADRLRAEAEAEISRARAFHANELALNEVSGGDVSWRLQHLRKLREELELDLRWKFGEKSEGARARLAELEAEIRDIEKKMGAGPAGGVGQWVRSLAPLLQFLMK